MKFTELIKYASVWFLVALMACGSKESTETKVTSNDENVKDTLKKEVVIGIPIDSIFKTVDTSFTHNTLIVPEGFKIQILFTEENDMVTTAEGLKAPAKGNHDMVAFLPDSNDINKGWIFVSHETKYADPILGDGGGATMFRVEKDGKNNWKITSNFEHVDFRGVGNTDRNCGGTVGPNGMIYSCEEYQPKDNSTMYRDGKGHLKTDSVGNLDYWQNIGYIVEIDPKTRKATQKMIGMGRYFHEDLEFLDDNKTVFLSDDYEPGVFFKFVADKELDYSQGQLYAFQQDEAGGAGNWLALPRDTATMIRARDAAIDMGATMFMRHEWFGRIGNKMYISETGHDETDWTHRIEQGGKIANALKPFAQGNVLKDVFGRMLVFDTETNKMELLMECGYSSDSATVISNPDCVTPVKIGGRDYLLIHEDLNGHDKGRVPNYVSQKNRFYNELYLLDLSIKNPTPNDVKRIAIAPMGAEFSGGVMSPDGSTLFINVMHPHSSNGAPYNKSMTVAITGFIK